MYYIYMLRCEDDSLYTGMTHDFERRIKEHIERGARCAKYTYSHPVKKVEKIWQCHTRQEACQFEYRIKQLSKKQKERLLMDHDQWQDLLSNHLDVSLFSEVEKSTYEKCFNQKKIAI